MSDTEIKATRFGPLEGRVAQILNARELVINLGTERGVKKGMKFAVMSKSPTEIRDPETGEVLDTVDREKVKVRASEVRPKIAICRTYLVRTIPGRPGYSGFSGAFDAIRGISMAAPVPERKVVDTLRADERDLPPPCLRRRVM